MLWCDALPAAAAALVFSSAALFVKMWPAIQFYLHVFLREPGGGQTSGAHPASSTALFLVCT